MLRALFLQVLHWSLLLVPAVGQLAAAWSVTSGQCTLEADGCISSPSYPRSYPDDSSCSIHVPTGNTDAIQVVSFQTESGYDKLRVNDLDYSGTSGPYGVVPQGTIGWSSDSSVSGSGWKICLQEMQVDGPLAWLLEGHCSDVIDGRYELQGHTASGRPFYKHWSESMYLYYDPDCDANPATSGLLGATWRVGITAPSMSLEQDLDNDGECRSAAYVQNSAKLPPERATWRQVCSGAWNDGLLTLSPALLRTPRVLELRTIGSVSVAACWLLRCLVQSPSLWVSRSCRSSLSGVYELQGYLLGRPWYKYENIITSSVVYLWYDDDEQCGAAWYFKSTAPHDGADSCKFYSILGRGSQRLSAFRDVRFGLIVGKVFAYNETYDHINVEWVLERADSPATFPPDSGWQTLCADAETEVSEDQATRQTLGKHYGSGMVCVIRIRA
ncbi:unnamed protein product, partial [Symbiodinium necroappetens]